MCLSERKELVEKERERARERGREVRKCVCVCVCVCVFKGRKLTLLSLTVHEIDFISYSYNSVTRFRVQQFV